MSEKKSNLNYLRESSVFNRLEETYLKFLAEQATTITRDMDEVLFEEGGQADHFYIVIQGMVNLNAILPGNKKVLVQTVGANAPVGWSWIVAPYTWHYQACAARPAILMEFDAKAVRTKCWKEDAFGNAVMRTVSCLMLERLHSIRGHLSARINELEKELEFYREQNKS